jgi:hypothetical protein
MPDPKKRTYKSAFEIESVLPSTSKLATHNEYLNVLRVDKSSNVAREELGRLFTLITKKAEEVGFAVTMVTMPASGKHSKRAANLWGNYALPLAKAPRRQNPEAFMSIGTEPSSSPAPPVSDLEDFPIIVSQANNTRARSRRTAAAVTENASSSTRARGQEATDRALIAMAAPVCRRRNITTRARVWRAS